MTKVVVEAAEFDLQLIKAVEEGKPVPQGEDYQKGEMLGHYNVRQYVLWRDGYTCQCCGAHSTKKNDVRLHVHHMESRKTGGNSPDNLVTLCENCHKKLHKGVIAAGSLKKRKSHSTRDAAFMGIMRKELLRRLRSELDIPVWETHGYVTKYAREEQMRLPKSHINDALAICHGPAGFNDAGQSAVARATRVYTVKPVRHHNRQLHKASILRGGVRKANQAEKYIKGFRIFDKVLFQGKECFVWGRRTSGSFLLKSLQGEKIKDGVGYNHLMLLERSQNYLISHERTERRIAAPPHV